MNERRREKRGEVKSVINVIDSEDGENIGELVDISPSGMRMSGKLVVDIGKKMELILVLPKKIFGKKTIDIEVQCAWSNFNSDTQYYQSGFEFIEVSQEDSNTIIGLVMEQDKME